MTKNKNEKKWLVWGLIGFTIILLATAILLFFQLNKPVEKISAPSPKASPTTPEVQETETEGVCEVAFSLSEPTPNECFDTCDEDDDCEDGLYCMEVEGDYRCVNSDCPEEVDCECDELSCFDTCDEDDDCEDGLYCMEYDDTGNYRCLNASCTDESDCECPVSYASPSPSYITYISPTPSPSPSPRMEEPELPEAGVSTPAVLGVSAGLVLMLIGLLF